ncbi:MAG TPA: TolC family protein [Gemmatales bacterium]|nr:TolC family protein [Gemmatales bacterium]
MRLKLLFGFLLCANLFATGCSSTGTSARLSAEKTTESTLLPTGGQSGVGIILIDQQGIDSKKQDSPDQNLRQVAFREAVQLNKKLSLAKCIDLAINQHPDLAIAMSQADAAQGQLVQAGLYPNPVIGYESDDMNAPGGGAGKQGASITQSIVTAGKLQLASSAAAKGVESADWKAQAKLFDVVTKVRSTFYDNLTAQQELETARDILKIAQDGVNSAEKLQKAGIVGQPDVLRAKVELEQSKVKVSIADQHVTTNWQVLTNVLGQKDMPVTPLDGSLLEVVPEYDFNRVRQAMLDISADLQAAQAAVGQADFALSRAEAEVVPDLQVQVRPFYSQPDRRTELAVGISAPLPIYNRNQGNIMAARANLAQAQATLRQVELQLQERLALAIERYNNAQQQVQAYSQKILPSAQESLRLILIAYGSGDQRNDFTAVLEAQRSLAQAKLGLVQSRGELQKATSEIEGILQRLPSGTVPREMKQPIAPSK